MVFNMINKLNDHVITPNLNKLADRGTTFTNCYCNMPLCTPSRASFVTGLQPHKIRAYDNSSVLPDDIPTFMHVLKANGYQTTLSGKMHFVGADQMHGFEERLTYEYCPADFSWTPDWRVGECANPGTGVKRLRSSGERKWNSQLNYDSEVLNQALLKIRQTYTKNTYRPNERRPLFLCTSFLHPHCPYEITKKYWDMYENMEIPMPTIRENLDEHHIYNQRLQVHHEIDDCTLTDEEIRNCRKAYFGMVSYIDDMVGQLVDELERLQMLDDTAIIFTSDHGDMLGEHNMWFKRTFFENSAKVPLIISYPKLFQQNIISDDVVSLVDVAATIADIGGGDFKDEWISDVDGTSLTPLLTGDQYGKEDWHNTAQFEYYGEGTLTSMIMKRHGKYKYVKVHRYDSLLFDLDEDPMETNNLTNELPEVVLNFEKTLAWWDGDKLEADILKSQRQRLLLDKAMNTGKKQNWGYEAGSNYDLLFSSRNR